VNRPNDWAQIQPQEFMGKIFLPEFPEEAIPVDSRNTRLVFTTYSVPFGDGISRPTSASRALKARRANSVCDICIVVSAGSTNWARRMSSNPPR
jgi:hypothetical protein